MNGWAIAIPCTIAAWILVYFLSKRIGGGKTDVK